MERPPRNREGGILVTKEIVTDKNLSEVTMFLQGLGTKVTTDKTQGKRKQVIPFSKL